MSLSMECDASDVGLDLDAGTIDQDHQDAAAGAMDQDHQEADRVDDNEAPDHAAQQMDTESVCSFVTATSMDDERCGHCSNLYDDSDHKAMTGDCGHTSGRSCWNDNNNACMTCSKVTLTLEPNYAIHSPRDLTSPEPIDPPQSFGIDGNGGPGDGQKMSGLQQAAAGTLAAASHLVAAVAAAAQSAVGMTPAVATSTAPPPAAAPVAAVSAAASSTVVSGAASGPGGSSTIAPARRIATPLRTAAKPRTTAPAQRAAPAPIPTVNTGLASIKVNCATGKVVQRNVNADSTSVGAFKEQIWEDSGISSERQQLLYRGKNLSENKKSLASYKVTNNASHTMQMACANYGG